MGNGKLKSVDCYQCKWRRDVPFNRLSGRGDAHSCCYHPTFGYFWSGEWIETLLYLQSIKRLPNIQFKSPEITVVGSPNGIKNGWFNHPLNFDPVWVEECTGFKQKEENNV